MKQYDRLLNALSSYPQVLEENQKDMQSLDAYVKFLMFNEKEISKFSKITEEICLYLDNYNFAQGYVLDEIPNNLKPLHALRLALVKMGELSKELSVYPDRYELKKKIQVCKELTLTCMDKLGIGEIEKLTRLVIANTQKLAEVKELIENDDKVLVEIQSLMDSYMPVLQRFKAYLKELQEYILEFPHQGVDDLKVVGERLCCIEQIAQQLSELDLAVKGITNYADRYGKNSIIDSWAQIKSELSSQMRFEDTVKYGRRLKSMLSEIKQMRKAFDDEVKELRSIQSALMQGRTQMWKDDNERFLSRVNTLLDKDTKEEVFDLQQLRQDIYAKKQKRADDIELTRKKHRWLQGNNRYRCAFDELISKDVTYQEYSDSVSKIRWSRILRLLCIPVVGWVILLLND